jgi:prepilin-type processing-associated H-X9-DG protein
MYGDKDINGFRGDWTMGDGNLGLFKKDTSFEKPVLTPVFNDSIWVDAWPLNIDRSATDLFAGQYSGASIGRHTIARHGGIISPPRSINTSQTLPGSINMTFADGHAETVKLEWLWNYYWHKGWKVPSPRPK